MKCQYLFRKTEKFFILRCMALWREKDSNGCAVQHEPNWIVVRVRIPNTRKRKNLKVIDNLEISWQREKDSNGCAVQHEPNWIVVRVRIPNTGKRKNLKVIANLEISWQREKDSNPHKQSQSLSCYPYTIPLFLIFCCPLAEDMGYYSKLFSKVNPFFQVFSK